MSFFNFQPSPSHGLAFSPSVHGFTPRFASDFFPPQQQQQYASIQQQQQQQQSQPQYSVDDTFPPTRTPLHFKDDPQTYVSFDDDFSIRPSSGPASLSPSDASSSTSSPSISFQPDNSDSANSSPLVPTLPQSAPASVPSAPSVQSKANTDAKQDKPKKKRRNKRSSKGDETSAQDSDGSSKKKRSALTKCACVPCRHFKAACDASRPCARCIRLNRADQCVDYVPRPRGGARVRVKKEAKVASTATPPPAPASAPSSAPVPSPPLQTERPSDRQTLSPVSSSGSSTASSSPPRPSPEPTMQPQFSVVNPITTGTMFQPAGFLNTLLPMCAPPLTHNDSLQGEWSKELPAPTATPVTELMWLEEENLFSVLEQFDKEAHSSQKNEKLLLAMAWILCDILIFSGCFRRPANAPAKRGSPPSFRPSLALCDEPFPRPSEPAKASAAPSSSLFLQQSAMSPASSLLLQQSALSFSLPQSVFQSPEVRSLFPIFRSLASPDLARREKLWTFLNSWKHEAEVQTTLQAMAAPYTAEAIEALYHSELLKSSFLPFGVVLCPLNPYFRTFPFYVNQRLHTMMGFTPEDAAELTTSCPFHRMAARSSLSRIKKLVYEAIRYSRTDFTLPMVLHNKFNQPVPVVVSSKFKFHGAIPVLGIFYVQFANQPTPLITAS